MTVIIQYAIVLAGQSIAVFATVFGMTNLQTKQYS